MDFSKLFYVSCTLPNKSKLKFDQALNASLKMLNESMYSMPWVRCAFGNSICSCFLLDCCICPWLSVKLYKKISFPDGWARNIFPKYWFSDIIGNIEHSCKKDEIFYLWGSFFNQTIEQHDREKADPLNKTHFWHCMCSCSCNSPMGSHSMYQPLLLRGP